MARLMSRKDHDPLRRWRALRGGRVGNRGIGRPSLGPRPLPKLSRSRRDQRAGKPKGLEPGAIFAALLALGTIGLVAWLAYKGTRVDLKQTGLEDDAMLNTAAVAALDVRMELPSADDAKGAELRFDGEVVKEPTIEGSAIRWKPPQDLAEGKHTLSLSVPRVLLNDARFSWDFTHDATPPKVEAPPVTEPVGIDEKARVSGKVEKGTKLTADGREVDVDDDGGFSVEFNRPPAGPVPFEAVDRAGNRAVTSVVVPVKVPGMRAVHVTAAAWSDPRIRGEVLQMLDEKRIDTVQLDLKDENGVVGFDTKVERAHQLGAVTQYYNLESTLAEIKAHGGRMMARIAAFSDPKLAEAAWAAGLTDQVVQTPDHQPFGRGGFTNLAHPEVQRYNLDIALDAVSRGVHNILWDKVNRPGSDPSAVLVPGLQGSPSDVLVTFLGNAHSELRRRGAVQGVVALGLSVDRGDEVGQDIAQFSRHADYVVPEIYPGEWNANEFDVASPSSSPGEFVGVVLTRWKEVTANSGSLLVPSLQDFSTRGVGYGEAEVRAQIDAARAAGSNRFLLWDPSISYNSGALDPQP